MKLSACLSALPLWIPDLNVSHVVLKSLFPCFFPRNNVIATGPKKKKVVPNMEKFG